MNQTEIKYSIEDGHIIETVTIVKADLVNKTFSTSEIKNQLNLDQAQVVLSKQVKIIDEIQSKLDISTSLKNSLSSLIEEISK